MTGRAIFVPTIVILLLACVAPSFADSDGYYCTFNGYLAYELREGLTPGVKGHVLRVVRYEAGRGIYPAGEITMKDFQVHGFRCDAGSISISGWGNGFEKYVVEISLTGLRFVDYTSDANRQFDYRTEPAEPANLGRYMKVEDVSLDSSDPEHRYALVSTRSTKQGKSECESEVHFHTELVQRGHNATVSERMVLFDLHDIGDDCGD